VGEPVEVRVDGLEYRNVGVDSANVVLMVDVGSVTLEHSLVELGVLLGLVHHFGGDIDHPVKDSLLVFGRDCHLALFR